MCIRFAAAALLVAQPAFSQAAAPERQVTEELRVESAGGTKALTTIGNATISPDGMELFVTQPLDHCVHVFDAQTGDFLRSIGRGGFAPGEFLGVGAVGWVADSLYVIDRQLKRVSLFTAIGQHIGTTRIDSPLQTETAHGSRPIGVTANGKVISEVPFPSPSLSEGVVTPSPWALLERDGSFITTLALRDLRETTVAMATPQGRVVFEQPLSRRNILTLHPDGTSMAIVDQPAGSDAPGTYEVRRLQADGSPVFARRFDYTPRRVSPGFARQLRAEYLQDLAGRPSGAQARATVEKYITIPPFHPPVAGVIVGRDDTIWLRMAADQDPTTEWLVLGPGGAPVALVRTQAQVELLYADERSLWAALNDDDGPPSLIRLRVND